MTSVPSISRQFAHWAATLQYQDLPLEVVDKVKALLLHALAGGVLGSVSPSARRLVALTLAEEGRPDGASVFNGPHKASRVGAAFANAELIHASYLFDSYRMLTHPGPVLVPAALANAELEGRSGRDLIVALAAGYEFVCRLADDFIPSTAARGFRPSPLYGTLGAALLSGKLMGLSEDALVTTIALAANFASGLNEGPRAGGNDLLMHEPQAARNGVFAAMMGRAGNIKGTEHVIEGPAGFYNAFTGNGAGRLTHSFKGQEAVDLATVTEGLGRHYKMLSLMYRVYPCPGYNQPVIELVREMTQRHALAPQDIEQIDVAMNRIETLYPSPEFPRFTNWQQARAGESTHFFAAHAAVHGGFPVAGTSGRFPFGEHLLHDPRVLALMARVRLVPQDARAMFSPAVSIRMKDGTVHGGSYPYERMVWTFDELAGRLSACVPGFPTGQTGLEGIVRIARQVDELTTVQALFHEMKTCTASGDAELAAVTTVQSA
ncbi:MAG: MmgE/PrpD family protein [Rhodoferax sp.]|nr:MmgE/PrpD family protein [Rhodoferax sp.]